MPRTRPNDGSAIIVGWCSRGDMVAYNKEIDKRRKATLDKMNRMLDQTVSQMRSLEQEFGHHGVFIAIREWLSRPVRAKDLFRRRKKK